MWAYTLELRHRNCHSYARPRRHHPVQEQSCTAPASPPPTRSAGTVITLRVLIAAAGFLSCGLLACLPLFRVTFLRGRWFNWTACLGEPAAVHPLLRGRRHGGGDQRQRRHRPRHGDAHGRRCQHVFPGHGHTAGQPAAPVRRLRACTGRDRSPRIRLPAPVAVRERADRAAAAPHAPHADTPAPAPTPRPPSPRRPYRPRRSAPRPPASTRCAPNSTSSATTCASTTATARQRPRQWQPPRQSRGRTVSVATGRVIAGRYELSTLIGQGGMGQVWTAYDQRLDRRVAVKLLRPDKVAGQEAGRAAPPLRARVPGHRPGRPPRPGHRPRRGQRRRRTVPRHAVRRGRRPRRPPRRARPLPVAVGGRGGRAAVRRAEPPCTPCRSSTATSSRAT